MMKRLEGMIISIWEIIIKYSSKFILNEEGYCDMRTKLLAIIFLFGLWYHYLAHFQVLIALDYCT